MPELTADLFISADGYARGERSPGYFGFGGPDLERWIGQQLSRPLHHLMGRKTYEILAGLPKVARDESWHEMVNVPTTVFSRTLDSADWPGAAVASDLAGTVAALKAGDRDLRVIGSLSLVRQLVNAGLVDRLRLAVFPLIVGQTGAEPAFAELPDLGLDLLEQYVLDGRIVVSEYRPAGLPPYTS